MPKINVYLPDELAEAVKEAGVPVSAICQRALEQAVRRVTAIRETALGSVDDADMAARWPHLTARTRTVMKLAVEQARADRAAPAVGSGHLLAGILTEGGNLALQVLRALEIEPDRLRRDLARQSLAEATTTAQATSAPTGTAATAGAAAQVAAATAGAAGAPTEPGPRYFSVAGANALELAVTEATALGHNYVGCEHLLLGLIAEPDGVAGQVLRAAGAELRLTRRAVAAALAGYVHLRAASQSGAGAAGTAADPAALVATAVRAQLEPLMRRIERLEERIGAAGQA